MERHGTITPSNSEKSIKYDGELIYNPKVISFTNSIIQTDTITPSEEYNNKLQQLEDLEKLDLFKKELHYNINKTKELEKIISELKKEKINIDIKNNQLKLLKIEKNKMGEKIKKLENKMKKKEILSYGMIGTGLMVVTISILKYLNQN